MSITETVQSLDLEAPIDLFQLSGEGLPATYFCNIAGVTFGGINYTPIPCSFEWLTISSEGATPSSRLVISDISGLIGSLVEGYGGMLGCTVTAIRSYRLYLDGQPGADSLQHHPPVILRINRRTWEPSNQIEFDCVSGFDLERQKIPGRAYLRRCQWLLSDENCRASKSINYDLAGNPTTPENRACGKDSQSCKRYHGANWGKSFGGYLGVQRR